MEGALITRLALKEEEEAQVRGIRLFPLGQRDGPHSHSVQGPTDQGLINVVNNDNITGLFPALETVTSPRA